MDEKTMNRVCRWFNTHMGIFGYEAKAKGNRIVVYDFDDRGIKPKHFGNIRRIIESYYDLLFENLEIDWIYDINDTDDQSFLFKLESCFIKEAKKINTKNDSGDLYLTISENLIKTGELMAIIKFKEY